MKKPSAKKGFTLIELLAVAAVIAAAAVARRALLFRHQSQTKLIRTAELLALTAKSARVQAVQTGKSCRLVLDRENRNFSLQTAENSQATQTAIFKATTLPSPVTFEQILILEAEQPDLFEIEFLPNGSAKTTAVIQLSDGKNLATVTIHQTSGRVKTSYGQSTTLLIDRIDLDQEGLTIQ